MSCAWTRILLMAWGEAKHCVVFHSRTKSCNESVVGISRQASCCQLTCHTLQDAKRLVCVRDCLIRV